MMRMMMRGCDAVNLTVTVSVSVTVTQIELRMRMPDAATDSDPVKRQVRQVRIRRLFFCALGWLNICLYMFVYVCMFVRFFVYLYV